ncbi:MAG: outer membrane beta-barrel protein [Vicinamibacterales bacterium]
MNARWQRWDVVAAMVCLFGIEHAAAQSIASAGAQTRESAPARQEELDPQPTSPSDLGIRFGATLEGYYQYTWNRPPDRTLVLRAYDTRSNSFSIQQAALVVDGTPDVKAGRRYGLRLDLQFGQATETVQGSPANEPRPDVYRQVWQAYGSYVFALADDSLQVDFGKFASMLGYETNYAKDNQAFSRAYLFNFLPFYHSGVRTTWTINDRISVLHMLTNGIQQTEDFNDFKSNHVAAVLKPTSKMTWTANFYAGQEQPDGGTPGGPDGFFRVLDTYVAVTPTTALTIGADVNHVRNAVTRNGRAQTLQGSAGYARYQLTPQNAIGARFERLRDDGLFGGIVQVLFEATLTAERKMADGFIARAEFRRDWSNEPYFTGRGGTDDRRKHQNTLLISGIWTIGTKTGAW